MVTLETTLTLPGGPTVLIELRDLRLPPDPMFELGLASGQPWLERGIPREILV
jgi:hypothetical protein